MRGSPPTPLNYKWRDIKKVMPGTGPRPRLNNKNMSLSPTSPPTLHPGRASPPTSPPPPPLYTSTPTPLYTGSAEESDGNSSDGDSDGDTSLSPSPDTTSGWCPSPAPLPPPSPPPPSTLPLSPNVCSNSLTHSLNNQVMSNSQLREEVRLWRKRGSGSRGSRRAPRPITRRMEASRVTREYGVVVCSVSCDE